MLETSRLVIRIMERDDIERLRIIHNESSTLGQLTDPYDVSQEEQVMWFEKISTSRKSRRYVIIYKPDDVICGVLRLDEIDTVNGSAVIGADISEEYRKRGLAYEAYITFISYLFQDLRLHRLQLVTLKTNKIAIKLYSKLGFNIEGELREAIFRNGERVNLLLMGLLACEWKVSGEQ